MARAISSRRSRGTFSGPAAAPPVPESSFIQTPPRGSAMGVRRWAWRVGRGLLLACSAPKFPLGDPQAEIITMLTRYAADWNAVGLACFMGDNALYSFTCFVISGHGLYRSQS